MNAEKTLDQLKRHPDLQHVIQYKRKYDASKTAASWWDIVATVNNSTSLKTALNVVRKIEEKQSNPNPSPRTEWSCTVYSLYTTKDEIAKLMS